jgi:hypothetical protein
MELLGNSLFYFLITIDIQNKITLTFGNAFEYELQIIKNILNININKP